MEKVVKDGNRAKFAQHPELLALLLSTGNRILAEAGPLDTIWGIGLDAEEAANTSPEDWKGSNLLGKILMELRDEFNSAK